MLKRARRLTQVRREALILGLIVALLGALVSGLLVVNAFEEGYTSGISPAPEVHKFRSVPTTYQDIQDEFCAYCHDVEVEALALYPHSTAEGFLSQCLFCHGVRGPDHLGHAAAKAQCVDCHLAEAQSMALTTAAHDGFYDQLGENTTAVSWACKACHTHHPVDIAEILAEDQVPPVPLDIDELVVPWS